MTVDCGDVTTSPLNDRKQQSMVNQRSIQAEKADNTTTDASQYGDSL